MTPQEWKEFNDKAVNGTLEDDKNPVFLFNMTSTDLLVQIMNREINPKKIAWLTLKSRGLDKAGKWTAM